MMGQTGFNTAGSHPAHLIRLRRQSRSGYSLIEVLLAIAILSMVLTATAVALRAMQQVDRQLKDNGAYGQVVPRLSLQLRSDLHAAGDVAMLGAPDEPAGISLTLAATGEVIEYQATAGRVVRTRRRGQEEIGHEVYPLGKTATLHWRTFASPSPMVELEIVRAIGKIQAADARQVDRIVAAIGIRVPQAKEGAADAPSDDASSE